jgi:hypothetical protein
MFTLYIDADACPVKDEVYSVARRYSMPVRVVANSPLRVPGGAAVEMIVCPGFGAADDWIAERAGPGVSSRHDLNRRSGQYNACSWLRASWYSFKYSRNAG